MLNATNHDILEYFCTYKEHLLEQLNSPQATVRERAQRVLNFIVPLATPEPSESPVPSPTPSSSNASIFDGDIFNGLDQQPAEDPIEHFAQLSVAPAAPAPTGPKRVARRVRPNAQPAEPIVEAAPVVPVSNNQARNRAGSGHQPRRRQSQPDEPLFETPAPVAKPAAKPAPPRTSCGVVVALP